MEFLFFTNMAALLFVGYIEDLLVSTILHKDITELQKLYFNQVNNKLFYIKQFTAVKFNNKNHRRNLSQ